MILLCAPPVLAAPWWWVLFTEGDNTSNLDSNMERWLAFAVNNVSASDTVYIASFTWGAGITGNDPINGLATANNVGLNNVANNIKGPGSPRNYLITDGSTGSVHLDTSTSPYNVMIAETTAGNIHHNKLIVIPGRRVITGSANFTTGAYSDQPNNMLLIKSNFPAAIARFTAQMEEFRNGSDTHGSGIFHDNSASGPPYHFNSPNGDTIEIYFNPDENGHIPIGSGPGRAALGSGADLEGVVIRVIQEAKQSIFYGINLTTMDQLNFLPNPIRALVDATPGKLVEGWLDSDNSTGAVTRGDLQNDHTSRNGNDFFTSEVHHKIFIIDQEIVITGSPNLTSTALSGTFGNDENMVVVHDFRLARKYLEEYRRVMSLLNTEATGQADSFDTTIPAAPTGFTVTATDTAFYASWTASTSPDVTRYFLFIDTFPMKQRDIGDTIDQDGDLYFNEDPLGDADGFPSGSTIVNSTPNDDDADGTVDEDTWAFPEVQVKGRTSTSGVITSRNVGDALVPGVNYYFAIVAVDTHGNESLISTFGPLALAPASDTRLRVAKNRDLPDSSRARGTSNVIVLNVWIRGDTTLGGDTLTRFAVRNLGLSDSLDLTVRLWRDEDNDSAIGAADTMVGQLVYSTTTGRYEATWSATDTRVRLGGTGKTFLVTVDLFETATIGETFQAQVDLRTCSASRSDSGPASTVTNNGVLTIVSANQLLLTKRGDTPSETIARGDSRVVMTLLVTVGAAGDTLTAFGVVNAGTLTSAGIDAIRIYHDGDADSVLDGPGTDTLIATLPSVGDTGWGSGALSYPFGGTTLPILVFLQTSAGAPGGATFTGRVEALSAKTTKADSGPLAAVSTTSTFGIASDTSPDTAIVLNEFIPDPSGMDHDNDGTTTDADEEFIELYNNSDGPVDVGGWKLDNDLTPGDATLPAGLVIPARGFLIVYDSATPAVSRDWFLYDSTGRRLLDSGNLAAGSFPALPNSASVIVAVANASNVIIDSYRVASTDTPKAGYSFARHFDGAPQWDTVAAITPGYNSDPTPAYNRASPNAYVALSATPSSITAGESFTLTLTVRTARDSVVTQFTQALALSSDTGLILPTTSGSLVLGTRSDSATVTGIAKSGSVVLTASWRTTTGTTAITVTRLATATAVVDLEARADESGCTGILANGVDTYVGVSNASGTITFTGVRAGVYTFRARHPTHLGQMVQNWAVSGSDTTFATVTLVAGDVNQDGRINIIDASAVRAGISVGVAPTVDVDGSGTVDAVDLSWVRRNFGRASN